MKSKSRLPLPHFALLASCASVLSLVLTASPARAAAAEAQDSPATKERALISVLQSSAPQAEKAITCKKLAIYGTKAAVPALAPLLADPELTSLAAEANVAIATPTTLMIALRTRAHAFPAAHASRNNRSEALPPGGSPRCHS